MKKLTILLLIVLTAALNLAASAPSPMDKTKDYTFTSTEIQLASRGTQIPATVVLPTARGKEKFPLVIIHHGHGGGRNENGGLARLAEALAVKGIASIRMDFPGAGDSQEPFTRLTYTNMLADSNAALLYAVRSLPVDKHRIGAFGYSEGSAVVAMQAGQPFTPYKAVALLGPVAHPAEVFQLSWGEQQFWNYYEEAKANGFAVVTTQWGQVQNTSLEWFNETLAADPVGDIRYYRGPVLVLWGEKETTIPYAEATAYMDATRRAASHKLVTIPNADHGYGFYSDQPDVDAALQKAVVNFFLKALKAPHFPWMWKD